MDSLKDKINKLPPDLQKEVQDFVDFLLHKSRSHEKFSNPTDELRKAAKTGKLKEEITDPVKWQREQRKDRSLPFKRYD